MHGCFNLNALVTNFASSSLAIYLFWLFLLSPCWFCWKGVSVAIHDLFAYLGFHWITYMLSKLSLSFTVLLSCSQFSATEQRTCLRTHGGVRSFQITCTWTKQSWSRRCCPTSTTRVAVLSAMVWAHAISDLAIATYATASVSTSVSSSVQYATAGTLCWKSIHESKLCLPIGHMAQSTISTGTSFISSANLGISISKSPINSTLLTHNALSTHSSGIAQHSIHSIIPASSSWHSLCKLTWWSNSGWW